MCLDIVSNISDESAISFASLLIAEVHTCIVSDDLVQGVAVAITLQQPGIAEDIQFLNRAGSHSKSCFFRESIGLGGNDRERI